MFLFTMKKKQAIGVFDSGIGGLTVAHQIHKLMPQERIVYFGDTQHLPYGDKSPEAILKFSTAITEFLLEQDCKMIVVACNTASAIAFNKVRELCGDIAIAINVIDPVVEDVCSKTEDCIGIIGTKNTIQSDVYSKKIKAIKPELKTQSMATPLLVPMIEEGFYQNKISETILENYLEDPALQAINKLILGCTHYPLIEEEIETYYQNKVTIVNSARIVSLYIQKQLSEKGLLQDDISEKNHQFYLSDFTNSFEQSAQYFFGEKIHLTEVNLWE